MDFHSLTRKDLQALCKKNRIPANITNVAMADALTALEIVDGLDEFLNQSQSQEKAVPESPSIPRTATRTSTRRKPVKEEPETAQPTTRTRRTTRRATDQDLDLENNNVNVVQTPAVPASRRRAPAASSRKIRETQVEENVGKEMTVETPAVQTGRRMTQAAQQGAYSTRRSVRLLEKSMDELSLKERRMPELVKMGVLDETKEKVVPENLENKITDSSSGESFMELLESERELKDDVQEKDKCDDNALEVSDKSDNVSAIGAVDDSNEETSENSEEMVAIDAPVTKFTLETVNPSAIVIVNDEISANADESGDGDDDAHVSEFPSETENASAELVMESENVSVEFSPPKVAADQRELEVLLPEEEDLELPFDPESWDTDSDQSVVESNDSEEEESDSDKRLGKILPISTSEVDSIYEDKAVSYEVDLAANLPPLPETPPSNGKPSGAETISEIDLISEVKAVSYEVDLATNLPPLPATPPSNGKPSGAETTSEIDSISEVKAFSYEVDLATNLPPLPATPPSNGKPLGAETTSEIDSISNGKPLGAETTSEIDSISEVKAFSDEVDLATNLPPLPATPPSNGKPSGAETTSEIEIFEVKAVSYEVDLATNLPPLPATPPSNGKPSGADTIATQFPRPTQSTPIKSCSSKKQTTDQKLATLLPAYNKENIDESSSGMEVEPKKDNVKNKKCTRLDDMSLRQLNKMLREKAQIQNNLKKNNDGEAAKAQVVKKTRPALQTLPENVENII